jgi:predicted nucleic acid-binding protein
VGQADFLITGDKDLLVLHPFEGLQILTLRTLLEFIQSKL